nr:MAG TPA: hypothetical protein [Caudoviricetes sp.]
MGALGTEARGLDASKIWDRYTEIVEPLVA